AGVGDQRVGLGAVERSRRRGAQVPQSGETQERGRERLGIGRIENADEVIRADCPIDLPDLDPEVLPGLIRLVDTARRVLVVLDALLRPVEEDDERGHTSTSFGSSLELRLYGSGWPLHSRRVRSFDSAPNGQTPANANADSVVE